MFCTVIGINNEYCPRQLDRMEEDRMPKRSSLKNWKGQEEGEDPGKDGKRK